MAADIVDVWHLSQGTVEGPSLQTIVFGIWYFWGHSGVPRGWFFGGLGPPDVIIIRAGGVLEHAMPCVSNVFAIPTAVYLKASVPPIPSIVELEQES